MKKFKLNSDLLDLVEEKLGAKGFIIKGLRYLIISLLLAVLYYLIYASIFNTKAEEFISKQNKLMEKELSQVSKRLDNLNDVVVDLERRDADIYKGIFKASPPILSTEIYSSSLLKQLDSSNDNRLTKIALLKIDSVESGVKQQDKKFKSIFGLLTAAKREDLDFIPSIVPIEYVSNSQTGASIGKKIHPFYKTTNQHNGLDLLAGIGTSVYSTANGVVVESVKSEKGNGNYIIISHGGNYRTVYSHLSDILVRNGQVVRRGSVIGRVGNSGLSFAPHLHYEVIFKGQNMEPINYFFAELNPQQIKDMLIIAINSGQSLD